MEYKFKVGDHVCVTDRSFEYCGDYRGKVGVVKRAAFKGKYGVELAGYWNHNSSGGYFWFNTQSLIPQEEMDKKEVYVTAKEAEELRIQREAAEKLRHEAEDMIAKIYFGTTISPLRRYVEIEKVIFNNPATIVFWSDGKKTVVKCAGDEAFDEEKGLAMAISKRVLGNKGNYYNEFKKWLPTIEVCEDKGVTMVEACRKAHEAVETFNNAMRRTALFGCDSCKYLDMNICDEPCTSCVGSDKYEPKKGDK